MSILQGVNARRWKVFCSNRRGYFSLLLFLFFFAISLSAEVIANDRPLLLMYKGQLYFPVVSEYPETTFGGEFETTPDYHDPALQHRLQGNGWMIWPPVKYSYSTVSRCAEVPFPAPPSGSHWLGTDDSGRDVLARLLYGFRLSVVFGLLLASFSSIAGICFGAVLGYHGGWLDMAGQRFMEIWGGMPVTYLLIILASFVEPTFWMLLGIMLLFSWMGLVDVVRAEFLKGRKHDYVRSARALGVSNSRIMFRHILPNALVATISFLPFILNGSITTLTSLDFLGFGMPPDSPALGELLSQGKTNIQAPWIGLSAFAVLGGLLMLLVFIGEAARDAFDPNS
ncbi:ABC transporter permease [Oleidesulfovibrio alaskensis]|jgi:microcin C transport system permease protein